ncbi:hypothetical protein L2750_12810 [Shewanella submarina]|uniref:Uncharacterized protein n=1 Tax=Shewanella submarina TaxID=2016376 RepID=A0ABV7GHZ4_9GAMM|nr:hypothetical protein [Shewanella submarina]MCL1038030.1 hypothetical protein [Shewanella submarina]
MGNLEEKVRRAWELLAAALGDDLKLIQEEVLRGESQLMEWGGGEFYTVTRAEVMSHGNELVIVAAAGKNSLVHLAEIHRHAKAQGFASTRIHTKKPDAMLRMSESKGLGYAQAETVLRAALHG